MDYKKIRELADKNLSYGEIADIVGADLIDVVQYLEGLKYYGISDQSYEDKCLECVDYIFKHDNLMVKINNLMDILYSKKDYDLAKLWKLNKMEELFGNDYHPYVTNIIVLLGYNLHT